MVTVNNNTVNLLVDGKWYEASVNFCLKALLRHKTIHITCDDYDYVDFMLTAWKCLITFDIAKVEAVHPFVAFDEKGLNHTIPVYEIRLKPSVGILRLRNHRGGHGNIEDSAVRSDQDMAPR